MTTPRVNQAQVLAAMVASTAPRVTQAQVLVALAPQFVEHVRVNQAQVLASVDAGAVPRVTQTQVLVAYRTSSTENLNVRAWTYALDGHTFYVLTLGEQGTFVYDESTGQWAQWQTNGLNTWNMEIGTVWQGRIIAADQSNPVIWELDPTSFIDDDFKPQTRVVTGGLSMRNRAFIPNYAFRITASLGLPEVPLTAPATEPTVLLETSDDQGNSYQSHGSLEITTGDAVQELAWLSLGTMQPPMRIFRLTDIGAVARIDGGDSEVGEEGS